jgi:Glycosyltransferase
VVVTVRGMDFKKGISTLGTLILRTANVITTINQKWAEDIKEKIGGEVFYTPNGVEVSENKVDPRKRFGINSGKIIVLYVGVLSLRKGADILARVAELTIGRNRSIQFLVVGPGNPKEFGLEGIPNVTYAGGIPPDEVLGLYAQCDIFALPSRHEGRPNSLLEAMASGLPSVATNLPGVIEILNNESGIIIDTENSHSFSEAILELAQNQERRRMMGQKAVSRIKELSLDWNTCANNYLRIFKEVTLCAE